MYLKLEKKNERNRRKDQTKDKMQKSLKRQSLTLFSYVHIHDKIVLKEN